MTLGQRRPYNPNTKYGRKKLREQSAQNYSKMTPEEQKQHDYTNLVIILIVLVVIGGIIYLISGSGALLKWLSR